MVSNTNTQSQLISRWTVSISISPTEELFGLLGPNGAGKTTLISIMTGLRQAVEGTVRYGNLDIVSDRSAVLPRLAWVPQEYAFYNAMTVAENLTFFGGVLGLAGQALNQRISEVVEITGLQNAYGKLANNFSGGMKRRLNVAISLLGNPDYLFLDEPTVGIDPQSRHFILESIRDIADNGTTVIYSSHYMEEVEALCDRIAIVDHGKILAKGAVSELLHGAQSMQASGNSSNDSAMISQPVTIRLSTPLIADNVLQSGFKLSQDQQAITGLISSTELLTTQLQVLTAHGQAVSRVQYGAGNLEQLFLQLTHRSLRD